MKTTSPFLAILLPLFLIAVSCTKDESASSKNFSIENADQLLQAFNKGALEHNRGELLTGNVYLRSASENRLAIYLQSTDLEQTQYYVLQTKDLIDQRFESKMEHAEILFFRSNMIVNALDRSERYLIKLKDVENPLTESQYTKIFAGFGLSRNLGNPFPDALERGAGFGNPGDPPGELACDCYPNSSGGSINCNAGGTGSTECSVSSGGQSCSTSCSGDYYSCCTF